MCDCLYFYNISVMCARGHLGSSECCLNLKDLIVASMTQGIPDSEDGYILNYNIILSCTRSGR